MPKFQSLRVPRHHPIQCHIGLFPRFGEICSCMGEPLAELSSILTKITFMECEQLLQVALKNTSSSTLTDASYHTSKTLISSLTQCIDILEKFQTLRSKILSRLACHSVSTYTNIRIIVKNLNQLSEASYSVRRMAEIVFWSMLDDNPAASSEKLASLMAFTRQKFSGISKSHSTVGISSFFAEKFLFRGTDCSTVCDVGQLVTNNQLRIKVLKWVQKTQHRQNISKFDRIYIPINGKRCHWYSACIDYRRKRIDIYDSLREVCVFNRSKPPELRQNSNLMMVLMWVCEVLATLRPKGELVSLTHPGQNWTYDPHAIVPFQPNQYDCGVHTLWHLKHIIEFGSIQPEDVTPLRFTQDMVGKRIRLAQELLDEHEI